MRRKRERICLIFCDINAYVNVYVCTCKHAYDIGIRTNVQYTNINYVSVRLHAVSALYCHTWVYLQLTARPNTLRSYQKFVWNGYIKLSAAQILCRSCAHPKNGHPFNLHFPQIFIHFHTFVITSMQPSYLEEINGKVIFLDPGLEGTYFQRIPVLPSAPLLSSRTHTYMIFNINIKYYIILRQDKIISSEIYNHI